MAADERESKSLSINITSTLVEKGFDAASSFLSKLISPAIEEVGLLARDKITMWRFKNQVNMLNMANEYCINKNISPKVISLKVMLPLLDAAGLEEDEYMQDKWATMLANMVDTETHVDNNVFPFILSQLSKDEYVFLDKEKKRIDRDVMTYNSMIDAEKLDYE